MEQADFAKSLEDLSSRQSWRNMFVDMGISHMPEARAQADEDKYDPNQLVEMMGFAYAGLTAGVHETAIDMDDSCKTSLESFQRSIVNTLTDWTLNNVPVYDLMERYKTSYDKDRPNAYKTYETTRDTVYTELLNHSLQTADYGLLLDMIEEYGESELANRLLNSLNARHESYPDYIIGDAGEILRGIDRRNGQIDKLHDTTSRYAVTEAHRKFFETKRHQIHDPETGMIKALAIGVSLKLGKPRRAYGWQKKLVIDRLEAVAELPSVLSQVAAEEFNGASLPT